MSLGLNTMTLADQFGREAFSLLPQISAMGYPLVEVALFQPDDAAGELSAALQSAGLAACFCSSIQPGTFLTAPDPQARRQALDRLRAHVELAGSLGSPTLAGPLYLSGLAPSPATLAQRGAEWDLALEGLDRLAGAAQEVGVTLCVEPANRYKTTLINTVDQAMDFIDQLGRPNVKILFDTYHANIEEASLPDAIRRMGNRYLGEIHVCDNHKGAPGTGHIDFPAVAQALRDIGYTGHVIFESFVPQNKDNIWTPLAPSQLELARTAYRYLAQQFS